MHLSFQGAHLCSVLMRGSLYVRLPPDFIGHFFSIPPHPDQICYSSLHFPRLHSGRRHSCPSPLPLALDVVSCLRMSASCRFTKRRFGFRNRFNVPTCREKAASFSRASDVFFLFRPHPPPTPALQDTDEREGVCVLCKPSPTSHLTPFFSFSPILQGTFQATRQPTPPLHPPFADFFLRNMPCAGQGSIDTYVALFNRSFTFYR